MMSQSGTHMIAIHILTNIFRRKGNQIMKLCQLTEYHMRHIFLSKSWIKKCSENSKSKLSTFWINSFINFINVKMLKNGKKQILKIGSWN